ncbi:MAG: viperin family antiviral radical SAM protein [Oscillospiraceae bacterium]|nr:viperin family antiviral radical SAM protein [Oscillospiraceae bacterium]
MKDLHHIKVNFHICEYCNYHCRHCFAKFGSRQTIHADGWKQITDNVLKSDIVSEINIAGGEPLMHPEISEIAEYIQKKGTAVSLVTNGSLMTDEWIAKNALLFRTVGFSIDALNPDLQIKIGRCAGINILTEEDIQHRITLLRRYNPKIRIKVNTVVSALNKNDCISDNVRKWKADRWKLLKMQEFDNGTYSNSDITVSEEEYAEYARKSLAAFGLDYRQEQIMYHAEHMQIITENTLKGDYIMIGANGCLLDNTNGKDYFSVCDCQNESFAEGLRKLHFDRELYQKRYN